MTPNSRTRAAGTAATTEARVEEKAATVDSEKIWEPFLRRFQRRKRSCETQLQQPTFLESKGAISDSVSRLTTRP